MGSSNWLRKGRSLWLMALLLAGAASAAELNPPAWNSLDHPRVPFVENRGQVPDAAVRFYARTFGGTVYVLDTGAVLYALPKRAAAPAVDGYQPGQMPHLKISGLAVLRESFAANQICAPVGLKAAGTVVNSIRGQDPAVWQNNLATYAAISLGQIQEGIELELRAHGHSVEKIFTVAPGADPARIRVTLEGAAGLKVKACGELEVLTELGPVCFSAPVAWQLDAAGNEISVPITYLAAADSFGFALGAYDATRPLWIDPLLASTFIGGSGADYIYAVAVEHSTSNVIVAGATDSLNFPGAAAAAGDLDVFIAKFDHNMTNLLAATYFGGSGEDVARALAVSNSIYVAGYTESADLPGATGSLSGERDAFVARFNTNLMLLTASYLGGMNSMRLMPWLWTRWARCMWAAIRNRKIFRRSPAFMRITTERAMVSWRSTIAAWPIYRPPAIWAAPKRMLFWPWPSAIISMWLAILIPPISRLPMARKLTPWEIATASWPGSQLALRWIDQLSSEAMPRIA